MATMHGEMSASRGRRQKMVKPFCEAKAKAGPKPVQNDLRDLDKLCSLRGRDAEITVRFSDTLR
jgi:hypothetical protein